MATACSDRFVRVYDRRMLQLRAPTATTASPALLHLAPLHMCLSANGGMDGRAYTTCARFSRRGDRLVATFHGEQVPSLAPVPCQIIRYERVFLGALLSAPKLRCKTQGVASGVYV